MPNHIINHVTIKGKVDSLQSLYNSIITIERGKNTIDFNKIVPMPESLNIEDGSNTYFGIKHYQRFLEYFSQLPDADIEAAELDFLDMYPIEDNRWELGKTAMKNKQQYGHETWYGWRIENWGTKWNAYECECELDLENEQILMTFQTAWSSPSPIFERLSYEHPDISVRVEWADEDYGFNCGYRIFEKGRVRRYYLPKEGHATAYRFSFKAWGLTPKEAGYRHNRETNTFEYIY